MRRNHTITGMLPTKAMAFDAIYGTVNVVGSTPIRPAQGGGRSTVDHHPYNLQVSKIEAPSQEVSVTEWLKVTWSQDSISRGLPQENVLGQVMFSRFSSETSEASRSGTPSNLKELNREYLKTLAEARRRNKFR